MRNIKLTIEYDGSRYHGWQAQKNAVTIQEVVQESIQSVTQEDVTLYASGRTDAGVHAVGQVASFRTSTEIPASKLVHAINARLPSDIAIREAEDVDAKFHACRSAKRKTYRYSILTSDVRRPFAHNASHLVRRKLDVEKMRAGAAFLIGQHDFRAFESKSSGEDAIRTVHRVDIVEEAQGDLVNVYVTGSGFLYNMVRAIVGTLLLVGCGKLEADEVAGIVRSRERSAAGPTAPARGLCLMTVEY